MKTLSLDQDNAHDFIGPQHPGGARPRPLTSSWMMNEREAQPPRKPEYWFFVDDRHNTLTKSRTLEGAISSLKEFEALGYESLVIRPYEITEETRQSDSAFNKWKAQHSL